MALFAPWRDTGGLCKRGARIQQRTVTTEIEQPACDEWTEVETRCCPACESEDD